MVFVPIGYVYPSRTPRLREVTVSLGVVWGALVVWLILALPDPPRWLAPVSLLYPAYYVLLSFYLHARRPAEAARSAATGRQIYPTCAARPFHVSGSCASSVEK